MNTTDTTTTGQSTNGIHGMNAAAPERAPEEIERDIEQQRSNIESVISQLGDKLKPDQLVQQAMQGANGQQFAHALMETVKANPMGAMLALTGIWMLYSHRPGHASTTPGVSTQLTPGYAENMPSTTQVTAQAGTTSPSMGERAHHVREAVSDKTHSAMDWSRQHAHQAKDKTMNMLEENPLAVGAIAIAVGALLGGMLPVTAKEGEWLGDKSQKLKDKAKQALNEGTQVMREATTTEPKPSSETIGRWEGEGGQPSYAGAATGSYEGSIAHTPSSLDATQRKH